MIEVINQCATLEGLLDALNWVASEASGFANYKVLKCHPTTSSDKLAAAGDNDLVLVGPSGEKVAFEVSDVASSADGNRKELKDLISLGVLKKQEGKPPVIYDWGGRAFLVVSSEFGEGLMERTPAWRKEGRCEYKEHVIANRTMIIEVVRGTRLV